MVTERPQTAADEGELQPGVQPGFRRDGASLPRRGGALPTNVPCWGTVWTSPSSRRTATACRALARLIPYGIFDATPPKTRVTTSSIWVLRMQFERHLIAFVLQQSPCLPDRLGQVRMLQVAVRAAVDALLVDFLL